MLTVNHTPALVAPDILLSEERLIIATQQDGRFFKKLYDRHYATVFKFALSRINDKQIAANIAQKVFSKALIGIKKYKCNDILFSVCLSKIALNECNDFFKSKSRKRCIVIDQEMSENLIYHIGVINSNGTETKNLKSALQLLSVQEVQLLELRYFEMRTFLEGGYLLGLSENTVKLKTYSLLNKIKRLMKGGIGGVRSYHNIKILDKYSRTSIEEIKSFMDFEAIWSIYKSNKLSAGQVLRRAFMSIGFA